MAAIPRASVLSEGSARQATYAHISNREPTIAHVI
jgi:hypothetical protein